METIVILAVLFFVFVLIETPIAFAIGLSGIIAVLLTNMAPAVLVASRMVISINSFVLLAVPLFILAGALMDAGGISGRLVNLAKALVGHLRGGLGMVVVVAEMFFSGISGSTVADVSAISSMLLPAMRKAGYKEEYAISIVSAASAMGILIPPCIIMVVLGEVLNVSIAALFFAGFLPSVVLAFFVMALIFVQAKRMNIPMEKRSSWRQFGKAVQDALIPLGMPVIIFGGILGGVFTPTEAAAVAVLYAFIAGVFVYRQIKIPQLGRILMEASANTGVVMLLVGVASIYTYLLAIAQFPQMFANMVLSVSDSPWVFLAINAFVFIVLGSVLEGLPAAIIFVPIFLPLAEQLGIDILHYGIIVVAALGIGLFLPPAGMGLIIACSVGNVRIDRVIKPLIPFLIVLVLGLLVLISVPWFTTVVPETFLPRFK